MTDFRGVLENSFNIGDITYTFDVKLEQDFD